MRQCPETLIVLDSKEHKTQEIDLIMSLSHYCNPVFTYSEYENKSIQFFHKLPFIGNFLTHVSYWWLSFIKAIVIILKYRSYKHKVFINPIVALFYTLLSRLMNRNEVITIAGFLFEPKSNKLYYCFRKDIVNFAYKKVKKIIVYSCSEIDYYNNQFPLLAPKFSFVPYGRNFNYSNNEEYFSNKNYISSGGRSNRDYHTLLQAMKDLIDKNIHCEIATRPECISETIKTPNVRIKYGITLNQFGSFIQKSAFFILPLKNADISAGHMALLEAMSIGKAILVTDIPAIRDYVSENEVFFYIPNDSKDLANKIIYLNSQIDKKLVEDKALNAKLKYEQSYTFKTFLIRVIVESLKDN